MDQPRVVVIGASAGGLDALRTIVSGLPADFPTPICIVVHTSAQSPGLIDSIIARAGPLPAVVASDHERLRPGHVYLAPADRHLLIEPGVVRLSRGPREHRFRPAIDPLFRSAAQVFGPAAVGVILSGSLDDGTAGLSIIKRLGGIAIVQDPNDALFPSMPASALRHVLVDYCVPLSDIASILVEVTQRAA